MCIIRALQTKSIHGKWIPGRLNIPGNGKTNEITIDTLNLI